MERRKVRRRSPAVEECWGPGCQVLPRRARLCEPAAGQALGCREPGCLWAPSVGRRREAGETSLILWLKPQLFPPKWYGLFASTASLAGMTVHHTAVSSVYSQVWWLKACNIEMKCCMLCCYVCFFIIFLEMEFPSSFTSTERAFVHRLCQSLGLISKSKG